MKQTIQEHEETIKNIEKALQFDERWYNEYIRERKKELEFYKFQLQKAKEAKKEYFDRAKYLVK